MATMFKIPYETNNGTKHAEVKIPRGANATGACGKDEQNITISWSSHNHGDNLNMVFKNNSKTYVISTITGMLFKNNAEFPNATSKS